MIVEMCYLWRDGKECVVSFNPGYAPLESEQGICFRADPHNLDRWILIPWNRIVYVVKERH